VTSQLWASVRRSGTPATFALIGVIGAVYVAQFVLGDAVTFQLAFYAPLIPSEPWRMVTTALVHGGIMHVMFNAYSLWVLGNILERILGSARFLAVFALSTVAGSIAVAILDPAAVTIGASAGIFGLFAALFIINRSFAGPNVTLLVIIGINLAIGFILPGIAWQAHIGGLIGGALTTLALRNRRRR
jgi:membrane associated rhomboid family serine protease